MKTLRAQQNKNLLEKGLVILIIGAILTVAMVLG
tara:strand:+ start:454 stop:555 length:102 start_codon:yes stop_codon:yes gene_type:complete